MSAPALTDSFADGLLGVEGPREGREPNAASVLAFVGCRLAVGDREMDEHPIMPSAQPVSPSRRALWLTRQWRSDAPPGLSTS